MKGKRARISLLLAVVFALQMLVGCGAAGASSSASKAGSSSASSSAQAASGKKVTLKWALWSADTQPYWRPIAEKYMAQHPDVTIELVDLGATDYSTALSTQLAGKDTPFDVVAVNDMASYVSMIQKGLLKQLDKSKIKVDAYGGNLSSLAWQGEYYTLPLRSDFYVMIYNKSLFDKAGVAYPTNDMTFEEYDKMARALTNTSFGNEVYGTHYHIWNACVQGMAVVGEGKNSLEGNYDYMKPYYEMVLSEQKDKVCMDYATLKTSGLHYLGAFGQGNVATMLMGTWTIGTLITRINEGQYPGLGDWAVASFPHKTGGKAGASLGTFAGVSAIKSSPNVDVAEDFVRFAGGEEGAKIVAEKGYFPGLMSSDVVNVVSSVKGFPSDAQSKEAIQNVKTIYQSVPAGEHCAEIAKVMSEGHDYIMTGAMTVDEGIKYMNDEVAKLKK